MSHDDRKYNYEHFWAKHLLGEIVRSARGAGLRPGQPAPEFDLVSTEGERVKLSGLLDRPLILHFGSGT